MDGRRNSITYLEVDRLSDLRQDGQLVKEEKKKSLQELFLPYIDTVKTDELTKKMYEVCTSKLEHTIIDTQARVKIR